jgi:hypothetical protein
MHYRNRNRMLSCGMGLLLVGVLTLVLSACGGSSGGATNLLHETFTGSHRVDSGNLGFAVTFDAPGSTTLKGPITFSMSGPFQSLGPGKLPESAFSISLAATGGGGSATITSTDTSGYVTFQGQSYKLPQATFRRLESSFSSLGSSAAAGRRSGPLSGLGIQPQHWLVNPQVVGDEAIDGTNTTHIHAGVNVAALLADLSTFLQHAAARNSSVAGSFPGGISPATRSRMAGEVQDPTVDVWTGTADKTLRRLQIKLNLALSGQSLAVLGGARSASVGLTMDYANLNQPQTITAPTTLQPYSQFQAKLRVLVADLQGALTGGLSSATGSALGSTGSAAGASGPGGTSGSSGPDYQAYTQCIQAAGGSITEMQKCAPLLNGG